jgi:carboxylesterase type B
VHVHGGGFQLGHGNLLTPKKLVQTKNVIVVTFNYRLGIHGFLCLGTEDVPGNAGLKDQVALLRWVKSNIANFGGNPDDVTLSGFSAGSVSSNILMLSPAAKGLFTRVIPESGGSLGPTAVQVDPLQIAKDFASRFINNVGDIYSLEDFYKTATYDKITSDPFLDRKNSTFAFTPCIERATKEENILLDSPYNILKTGNYEKVPVLYGFANMEGLLRIDFFPFWKDAMNEKFSDFLPADLIFESDEEKNRVAKDVKEFYFQNKTIGNDNILSYVDYFTDVLFAYPMLKAGELHGKAGHNKIYLYDYNFVDDDTPVVPHTNVRGAPHAAQSAAIADGMAFAFTSEEAVSSDSKKMKIYMRDLWSNFIRTG